MTHDDLEGADDEDPTHKHLTDPDARSPHLRLSRTFVEHAIGIWQKWWLWWGLEADLAPCGVESIVRVMTRCWNMTVTIASSYKFLTSTCFWITTYTFMQKAMARY